MNELPSTGRRGFIAGSGLLLGAAAAEGSSARPLTEKEKLARFRATHEQLTQQLAKLP